MKKNLLFFQAVLFVLFYNSVNAQYCTPAYTTGCEFGDGMTQFHLNTINQVIPCSGIPNYYHDYTSQSTNLAKNGYYILSGQSNNTMFYISVWIDYNNNTTFDNGTELIGSYSFNNPGGTFSIPITIPGIVSTGPTRLRIMSSTTNLISDPCTGPGNGNSCDFTVNIVAPVTPPTVITQGATVVTSSTAVLNGSVNAHDNSTYVEFHYGTDISYGNTITSVPAIANGSSATNVSSFPAGLLPSTTYHYEVVGYGPGGYVSGGDITFTTDAIPPPTVSTNSASSITGTSAILNGTVIAHNSATAVSFEYGIDITYGRTIDGIPPTVNSNLAESITAPISGLALNTTYHFRIISTNSAGTSYGDDMTFTTMPSIYCIPVYSTGCNSYNMGLTYFALNTISQLISCTGTPNYYHDFMSTSTELALNGTYSISVQAGGGYGVYITIWIDYNKNNLFDGAGEIAGQGHCNGGSSASIPITIPGSALTGPTGLRAMTEYDYYGYPSSPCSTSEIYGNCSDFTVNILPVATVASTSTVAANSITSSGASLNGTVNANGYATAVFFDYGLTVSYGSSLIASPGLITGSTPTSVNTTVTGLLPNTLYHFRVRGSNAGGLAFGDDMTFTTSPVAPIVTTSSAILVTGLSATLTGTVNPNNSTTAISFEYGLTASYGSSIAGNPVSITGYSEQTATAPIAGLSMNTTYHFRIVSTNEAGTSYGSDMAFTTLPTPYCIPVFSTGCNYYNMGLSYFGLNTIDQPISCSGSPSYYHDFTSISTELVLNGSYSITVQAGGGYGQYIMIWIDYNQNGVFDAASETVGSGHCNGGGSSTIPFTVSGTSLTGSTWLRAMSRYDYYGYPSDPCSVSEIYGNCSDFTVNILSSATPATIATVAVTNLTGSDVSLNGSVNANGYSTIVFFDYGLTNSYGTTISAIPGIVTGSSPTDVTAGVSGLLPNTLYHFRARGSNAGGITLGDDLTFTTNAIPPVISTGSATLITGLSATLTGTVNPNNSNTSVSFEYGLTSAYGTTITGNPPSVSGYTAQAVTAPIAGLSLNTTYHYRITSTNSAGSITGDDMTFTTSAIPYCIPAYSTGCNYYNMGLTYFGLNTISQPISCSGSPSYYHDFTSTSTDLVLNGSYSISVQAGGGYGQDITIWIDYDQNGVFDAVSELVGQGYCGGSNSATIPITVSGTALTGTTWLRAMTKYDYYGYPSDPCSISEVYGNCSDFTVNILASAALATATTTAATAISGSVATLNGTVNANGFPTAVFFDFGLTAAYGTILPGTPSLISGSSPTDANATVSGLLPKTLYHFRIRTSNAGGTTLGDDLTFTSSPIVPIVSTGSAIGIGGSYATLNGTVDANNSTSSVSFEYGLDATYGSIVDGNPSVITGHSVQSSAVQITGLAMNTIYHYRIVSTNEAGTSYGNDLTFSTLTTPYCIPVYNTGCNSYNMGLTYFELNSITQPISCSGSPNYYHDFTASSTDLALDGSYSISVQAGGSYGVYVTVWIDFNQNNIFDGTDEIAGQGHCYGSSASIIPITVSATAGLGSAGLRIMTRYDYYGYPTEPCSASEIYGNCSDFTVNIVPSTPPVLSTVHATSITGSSALLNGLANANGMSTDLTFEYGLTAAYGSTIAGTPTPLTGGIATTITGLVSGLTSNTTFHYRLSGTSSTGTTSGDDMTFTTLSSTATQAVTSAMNLGATNQQILGIEIVNPNPSNPLGVTSFTFNTNGCTQVSDLSNAKLYYTGTSGVFSTAVQFGPEVTDFGTLGSSFFITGNQALSTGNNHFWLAYDISPTATGDDYADAECTSITAGNAMVPTITAPAGNRQITDDKFLESITVMQASTAPVLKGSSNNEILLLDFHVTGTTNTLPLNSIVVSNTGYDSDISAGGVQLYRTSVPIFSTANLLGTVQSFSSLSATFSSLSYDLPSGHTYIWVTYSIATGAIGFHTADGKIAQNAINVNGTLYPVTEQNPAGNRLITVAPKALPLLESAWATIPPIDWNKIGSTWFSSATNFAGGTPNELKVDYAGCNDGDKMVTPPLIATGLPYLVLRFKNYLNNFGAGCTLRVQSSSDGNSWTNEAWSLQPFSGGIFGPYDVVTTISSNLGAGATYVAFAVTGNPNSINDWYIDNVKITAPEPPLVTTTAATLVTGNSASAGGNVTDDAANPVSARGICWSTSSNPSLLDSHTTDGTGLGTFSSSLAGLNPGTTYHIRAYATNGIGTAYGLDQYFTTLGANVFNVTGGGTFCTGGTGLSVGLDGSDITATYQLYNNALASGSPIPGTGSALSWDNLNDGTYTVEAITGFGTTIMIGNAVISSYNNPVSVSIVSTAVTTCPGTSITYTATPVNGGPIPVYQWKVNNIDVGSNSFQYSYVPNGGDQVRCVLTSNIDCPSGNPASSNIITMILAVPSPNLYGSVSECVGAAGVTYSTDAGGGISNYNWFVSPGGTITSGGGNTSSVTVTWNAAGPQTVSVNYTNSFGCSAAAPVVKNVTVNPLPIPVLTGPTSACTGSAGNVYATESGKSNYSWIVSAGGTITSGGNPSSNTATITWNTAGSHSVSVNYYDASGCVAASPTVTNVTVNPIPTPPVTGPVVVCAGATGNAYTTNAGMTAYAWSVSAGGSISSGGTATDNTVTVTWNTVGSKTVSVNYINPFGCTASTPGTVNITVNPVPVASNDGPATACIGSSGNAYITEPGMTNYVWVVSSGGSISAGGSASDNSVTVTWNNTGPQTVSVNYTGSGGCSPASPTIKNVSVNELPSVSISGNTTACEGDTVTYSAVITNGGSNPSYHWFVNGAPALSSFCGGALSSGLTAYYPFNANANDASGNGKNGTVSGATLTSDRFGNPNSAYTFNGSGNYISIPVNINTDANPQLTMLAWVKPLLVNPIRTIISHDNGTFDRSLAIDSRGSGTGYSCFLGNGILGSFPAITNQWVQVAVKYNQATNTATLYSNTSSISGATSFNTGWNYTWIGGNPSYGEYFSGVIDDVRIYNRLLSNDEITALYNNNVSEPAFCYVPANGDLVTCVVTNDAGCSGTSNAVNMSVLPTPAPTVSGPAAACQNSIANTYTTESGKTDYAWSVTSGGTITSGGTPTDNTITVTWTNAGAQSIGVNYKNTNLCDAPSPASYAVSVNALPVPSITGVNSICGIPSSGTTYSTEAGMTGYTWTVSSGGTITSGSGTNSVTVVWETTGAKSVTVTYTDSHSCTPVSPTIKNVDVYSLPVPSITGPSSLCGLPSTGNIYATEAGMSGYTWTVSAGGTITSGSGSHSIAVTWTTTGAKTVTVTYAQNGCPAASPASYAVDVNSFITPTISGPISICRIPNPGNVYTTEASMTNYIWTVSAGGAITSGGTSADDFVTVEWTGTGAKTVTVNYNNGVGCTSASPIVKNVNVYATPVPTISGSATICGFPSAGHIYSTEAGMSAYVWSIPAGGTITSGSGTNTIIVSWETPGLHTVNVTYLTSAGCTPDHATSLPVYVYGLPVATLTGPSSVCGTPSSGNTYSTEAGMFTYIWTLSPGGYIASGSGTNTISVVWTSAGAKTVTVTYHDGNGCSPAIPAEQTTNVYAFPSVTITGNSAVCGIPSTGNTYTTETAMTNYTWTVSPGGTITGGGTSTDNSVTVDWISAGAKTITVNYTDANSCTLASPEVKTVHVEAVPEPTITGTALICGIPSAGNTYSTQSGMTGYLWSVSAGGTITSGSGTNSIHVTWTVDGPQTVSVNYTTAFGCAPVAPANLNVSVNAFVASTISGPTGMCGVPSTGNVYSADAGMSGYIWTVSSGGTISAGAGTNAITVTWSSAGAKTVTITYTDGNGCSPASPVVKNVDVYALPVPVITGSSSICDIPSSGNVYSTEAGMTGYTWNVSPGGTITAGLGTNSITVTWTAIGAQTVDVVYTDSHSCSPVAATVKNVNVYLFVPVSLTISASGNPTCEGTSVTYTATPVNGGASPAYQWKVNGSNTGWNSPTFWYVPANSDIVTCVLSSSLPCTTGNPATSNAVTMTVNAHPDAPLSGGNQTVCSTTLPALLGATAPVGSVTDWYNSGSGGSLLLGNSNVFSTSTAGNYYAESRNLTTGCKSNSRTTVNLTVNAAIQYFIDIDGDGYGNPEVSVYDCTQPLGYVANALDCNDNNPDINPGDQYFAYTGNAGFTSSVVSPETGSSYTIFHFEADYVDATNSLPGAGYPRLILDYEGNGSYTDAYDRVIIMTGADPLDLTTSNGKRYFTEVTGLTYGTNWKARMVVSGDAGCTTTFGPFDYPDVLHEPNIYLFANDISFSDPHPDPSQSLVVSAVVHNESDFAAQNFVCHLINQWDTLISYTDITVPNLPAHQNCTVQWNITTPDVPAWCPMQVRIDYTDVIDENNELDNTAVRPFVNGNYQVAGSIVVQSAVSPSVSYANQYTYLLLAGRAWYTELAVQLSDSTVAGATVEFTVTETGATYSGYTNSWGYFNIYFPAPVTPGVYHITGSVTDFTLTRNFTNQFTILAPVVPDTKPNLTLNYCHSVDVQPVNPHLGATVTLVAHVSNNGNATATGPIEVLFTYSTGGSWLGSYPGNLDAGQSANISVTAPTPPPAATILTAQADPNNTVVEWNESFGDNSSTDNMCYDFQPVGICGGNFWGTHCVNTSTGIYVGLNSYHLYDANPVEVLFEVSGPGISGWQNLGTGTLNNVTRNCYCPYIVGLPDPYLFAEVGTYTFRMTTDPDNDYPECSEANNVLIVTVNSVTCVPPETKPNLAFASCYGLQVQPVNPTFPGMATLVANITNNGNATATGPIDVEFSYSAGTFTGTYVGDLGPGQSAAVTVTAPLPVPATTILTGVIDPANTVVEWNETDNTNSDNMCWEFQPVPHCGTNFWSHSYLVGQSASLSVGLNVQHLYDANPVKVKFTVSGPGIAGTVNLGNGILNNATRNCWCPWNVSLPMPFTFFVAGTYHFTMTADPDNNYTECDETNNILEVDVTVLDGADMRILSQYINPDYLNPGVGDSVSLIVSYENIGNSNVDDVMKLRINVDEILLDDIFPVSGLATGDHASIAIPSKWASNIPGAHVIRAIIDMDAQIPETNESNNEATRAIIVGESANLYFQVFAASNTNPDPSEYIHVNTRIGNNGDVNATATVKFYYFDNAGDTLSFGQTSISVFAHDSTTIIMPWVVADNSTTLIGKIVDVNVQEFNPDDNTAIEVIGGFDVTLTSTNSCYKMNNGTLTAHVSGGTAPYLYAWDNGDAAQTLTTYAGEHSVTVTDNTGLSMIATGTISNDPFVAPGISGPISSCINSSGNVYTTEAGMSGYLWSVSGGGTITAGGTSLDNSVTVSWNTAGTQHVNVNYTNSNGCTASSASNLDVTVNSLVVATITGSDTAYVFNTANVYTTEAGMSGYIWTVSAGGTITEGSGTNAITVTWSTTGSKTVTATYYDGNDCSPVPAVKNLTVYSLPVPTITGSASICGIPSTGNICSTEAGMNNYIWTVSAGGMITSGSGTNTITIEWSTPGAKTVTVTYMDSFGNSPLAPTVLNVMVESMPVPVISGPASVCGFPSAGNIYTTESDMTGYTWTVSAGGTITSGSGTNAITVTWATAGPQTVTVTYATVNGCAAASPTSYDVNVYPFTAALISGPSVVCGIPSVGNVYSTVAGMPAYAWSVSAGGTITSATNSDAITVTWASAGANTVSLTYTDNNGCSPVIPVVENVSVNALPVPVITGSSTICGIPSSGNTYSTEAGMSAYVWHVSSGGTITSGPGTNTITVDWTSIGDQTVDVTYADTHGCTPAIPTVKNIVVTEIVPFYFSIISTGSTCAGSTETFTISSTNAGSSPTYQWTVNGLIVGTNSPTYSYIPINGDAVGCTVLSSLPCTIDNPVFGSINITVFPNPDLPSGIGNQIVCSNELPVTLSTIPPVGSTVDWYNSASGGSLLLAGSTNYSTSIAGSYYAEARDLTIGCRSIGRTPISLTINAAALYFIDMDGDGYGNPEVTTFACSLPVGYVDNGLDCNDGNPYINPVGQHFAFTGNSGFVSSIVSPATGTPYTLFHFEADYFDATNSLPGAGYPRLILDYEGNGGYTDPNDRVIIMTAVDPLDANTADGKRYFAEVNGLPYGTDWKARIVTAGEANCATTFGPFDYPDVLHESNIYLFANDITFSDPHPDPSQAITVSAVVHNESDFAAQNFVCHLLNQWDTLISYTDVTVPNLPAHQNCTVQWNITTPAVPAWCPMKVTIDYTDVIAENNELDNTAVRPFVNGNYQVAGKIVVQSFVSPATSYAGQYGYLLLSGRAWYTDLAVQLTDSTVAGATVDFTIAELGQTFTGYTNSWGYFSIYFPATDSVGTYHITTSVTDFTLTGTDTTHFHILQPVIPDTKPNLNISDCHSVNVLPVDPHLAANVTLAAHVVNNGNQTANGPIEVLFTYASGGSWTGQYAGNLEPGQSANVSVVAPVPASATELTAYVDPNNTVAEWTETAADNSTSGTMCYDFQPVGICGGNFWGTHCINTTTGVFIGLNVSHLYDASQVAVHFEVFRPGIAGWQNLGTAFLDNATRNCYCPYVVALPDQFLFDELGTYTFRMTVDPDNNYPECDESNNVLLVTVNVVTCIVTPPEIKANLAFISCKALEVQPVNPLFPGMATLVANIVNNGDDIANGPINVDFTYSGGTFTGVFPGNMSPGQSAVVTVTAPLPAPATTILTASIDPANTVPEWSDLDNTVSDNMCWEFQPVPHCGTNFWSHTYLVGQSASLSVGLNVQHLYDANPVKVKFEVSGPGIAGTMNLGNATLNNATRNCNCPWGVVLPLPFTFFEAGTYHFTMTSDPDNNFTECNEANNVLEVDVTVVEGADMRILSQYINPDPLNPAVNDSVSFIVTYENIGNSNVNDEMKLKVILDNTTFEEIYPVMGLATGDHASVALASKWATSLPGAHVIRAIIDADNQVPEINETNNEATRAIIVGECANLYFQVFAASNTNPAQGDYIHINARIGNAGDVNATATVKFYYLSDAGDTIPFGQSSISVFHHDSTSIIMPWVVADNLTTLIGKIVNVNVQEFNPDDNVATAILGGFGVAFTSTPACYKGNNGTLTASVTGGTAPYLYLWSNGYIGETLTAGAGDYTITVTDNTGLSMDATGSIANSAVVSPSVSGLTSVCINSANVVYTTEAGMTDYIWIIPSGAMVTAGGTGTSNSVTLTWTEAGNHTISVSYTGTNGCAAYNATNYVVTVNPAPVPTLTGPATACLNSVGNVYSTQAGMSAYSWTVSAGGMITAGGTANDNTVTVTWNTLGAQQVSAYYRSASGCNALSATPYNVTVNTLPVPVITGPASACAGSTGNIYTTDPGMTAYSWSVSAGGTITAGAGTNAVSVSWNTAGAQTVSVNYSNANNCSATAPTVFNVTVNPSVAASVSVAPSQNNICLGTSVNFTATPIGGGVIPTYQWYKNTVPVASVIGSTYTYVPANGDVVYVAMTSNASCATGSPANSSPVTMVVNSPVTPTVSIVASANPVAAGTLVTFTPTPVNGGNPTYQWFVNNVFKASGATYAFVPVNGNTVKAIMTTSLTCVTITTATSNIVTMSIPLTTWTGAVSSAWLNAANWSNGVPGALTSVVIPAGVPNFPTLTSAATCANMTINDGGSFIGSEFLTLTTATIKRTLTNNLWHYMSSPVVSATFSGVFNNSLTVWAKEFNPVTNAWVYKTGGQPFVVGRGYSVGTSAPPVTATFTGALNKTAVTTSLLSNNGGWNMLGNPFQSAINWDNVIKGAGVGAAVYVWTGSNYVTWTTSVGGLLTGGIIPAEDGFFVTTTVTGSTVTIPLTARVHSAIPYYKESAENLLEIQAYGNEATDRMFVHFNNDATPAYDYEFDAMKLYGEDYAPQLYSIVPNNVLSINELPLAGNETVDVGFKCNTTGEYSLTASGMESFDSRTPIWLEDTKFKTIQDLRSNPVYSFSYVANEDANRFKLHFKSGAGTEPANSAITVYSYEHNVIINNPTGLEGEVWIYDITGRELIHASMSSRMKTSIPVQAAVGTYMVKVVTTEASVTQKVFIR